MKAIMLFGLMALLPVLTEAQQIQEVNIDGLKRTHESYIRQFITTQIGDEYDSLKIELERQRLANLEIMAGVSVKQSITPNGITLTFICREMVNIIPIFALGQTKEIFWCRAGVQDANMGGRGGKLIAYYQYYDRHSTFIKYTQERINNKPIGFSGTLIKWATIEPLTINQTVTDYTYNHITGGASVIANFGFRESVEVGLQGFQEEYERRLVTNEPSAPQRVFREGALMKGILRSNHINISSFYWKGFSNQLTVEFIKRSTDAGLFHIIFNDFKYFHHIGKTGNLATRLRVGTSTNEATPFAPYVLDSFLNIRGVGNRVDRGTGSVVANVEYRQTFFDRKLFAGQAVAFMDFGTWRKPGGNLSDFKKSENMKAFSGLGLRFIYKRAFDTMLRLDYGFDYNNKGGLVVGIGQYF